MDHRLDSNFLGLDYLATWNQIASIKKEIKIISKMLSKLKD